MFLCILRERQGAFSGSLREAFRHMIVMALQPSSGSLASLVFVTTHSDLKTKNKQN